MRMVNFITFFRILAFPIFIILLIQGKFDLFKWLLVISFLTDALDGFLARKFKVKSILGSRLDSLGDDLTVLAAVIGLFYYKPEFLKDEWGLIALLFGLFLTQNLYALLKYQRTTSFHTYGAKIAAVLQGVFLCSLYFVDESIDWLFYTTVALTGTELIEEMAIVYVLPQWKTDVPGLYWALKAQRQVTKSGLSPDQD